MTVCETISLKEAEQMTGLPTALVKALAECGEIPSEARPDGLYVGKAALLGWCRLFAKILNAVASRQRGEQAGSFLSARNLVWMAEAGLLNGRDRIRV